eukprot:m51a1_g10542 putative dna helicase mcm9 (710) ;mRNA; r:16361-19306
MPRNYCPYPYESFTQEEYSLFFQVYLLGHHEREVLNILHADDPNAHYGVVTNFMWVLEDDQKVGSLLLAYPQELFELFDRALESAQQKLLEDAGGGHDDSLGADCVKTRVHVRLENLHMCPEICRDTLPRSSDVGKFLELQGTVVRTGSARLLEYRRKYRCTKCNKVLPRPLEAVFESGFQFELPSACETKDCQGRSFKQVEGETEYRDLQEVKIQEQSHKVGVGSIPRQITVVLLDDMVDKCQPGDSVTVVGQVRTRWKTERDGERCDVEVVVVANNVRADNESEGSSTGITEELRAEFAAFWQRHADNPLIARDEIISSICPSLYGLYVVKLAVALVLIGGTSKQDASGMKIRGQCHLLLVGEPGTGKSQFLKFAAKLGPRHVQTTGGGTSVAGLTCAATREPGGEWILEAGALVLADGGVCCVDEFGAIKERDRTTVHEAMEQQTVSVAKAGIVCQLHTRAAVLAATNAKGRFDPSQSLSVNLALDAPLLSRFDMVLVMLDTQNDEWDEKVANFILTSRSGSGEEGMQIAPQKHSVWPVDKLQTYLNFVKTIQPVMTDDAQTVLSEYYQRQRRSDTTESARSTIRLLESLIRIGEAHAKLMMHEEVTLQDAIFSVLLVEDSMMSSALGRDILPSALHSEFPDDPEDFYHRYETAVLKALNLAERITPYTPAPQSSSQAAALPLADKLDSGTDDDFEWLLNDEDQDV